MWRLGVFKNGTRQKVLHVANHALPGQTICPDLMIRLHLQVRAAGPYNPQNRVSFFQKGISPHFGTVDFILFLAKTPQQLNLLLVTCYMTYLCVVHFKRALNSGEARACGGASRGGVVPRCSQIGIGPNQAGRLSNSNSGD